MQIDEIISGTQAQSRVSLIGNVRFHAQMLLASLGILILSIVGCRVCSIRVPDVGPISIAAALGVAAFSPLILYFHEKGLFYLLDAILTVFWGGFFYCVLNIPVTIAARLGAHIALQDQHLIQMDRCLRVYVPDIAAFIGNHGLGSLSAWTYFSLIPLLWLSVLLPTLSGKVLDTQVFLTANLIAFALGLPLFALLPAIGPWYGYHLAVRPDEAACQNLLILIRTPGIYVYHPPAGIICFPSFHVIWAILCGRAFWGFRWLRIPVSILATMIVFSTLGTGVHYFCDVLAGIFLAAVAIFAAHWLHLHSQEAAERIGQDLWRFRIRVKPI